MIRHLLAHVKDWDKSAIIENDQSLSYRDLLRRAVAMQKQFPQKQGEVIAIFLPNSGHYMAALFGTFLAGMVAFPLNVQLTTHEIASLLAQTRARAVVTSVKYRSFFEGMAERLDNPPRFIYAEALAECEGEAPPAAVPVAEDAPMVLLTTSGTTGSAKIVQLSERNVETAVLGFSGYNDFARFGEDKIIYILGTPFSSVYGLLVLSTCLMKGFPIVIPNETLTVEVLYREAEKHRVTHYEGGAAIPILMDQMADRPIPYDISSLRFIGFGGSKVTPEALGRLARAFPNIEVCPGYGSTESSSLIARPYKRMYAEKLSTVGIAIPHVTVMVDADGVLTDAPHTVGEVVAKGPNVMLGYYENEEETRKIIRNGYLYTGDIGYLDEEGCLFLCGRKKNVILVRGFSVYAEEVEACLLGSGLVRDCIVYGEADDSGNEVLCANIVPMASPPQIDAIRSHCGNHLAEYKQPQKILIVESVEKTATGKAIRAAAEQQA